MEVGEDEYEEEEAIILAELNGLVDDDLLKKGCTYQFVGIDKDQPVLQLGKYNFLGKYEDQIGSALFLKETTDGDGSKTWSKLCFSDKKLTMQRVFLRKKEPENEAGSADQDSLSTQAKQASDPECVSELGHSTSATSNGVDSTQSEAAPCAESVPKLATCGNVGTQSDQQSQESVGPSEPG